MIICKVLIQRALNILFTGTAGYHTEMSQRSTKKESLDHFHPCNWDWEPQLSP